MEHRAMRIPEDGWLVVCDGAGALLLRNRGDARHLDLVAVETLHREGIPAHEAGADRPGRVIQPFGAARSAVQQTDLHERAEIEFLATVMDRVEQAVRQGRARGVALVAPPRVLGRLRDGMPQNVRDVVLGELAKDLTHLPVGDIERYLAAREGVDAAGRTFERRRSP